MENPPQKDSTPTTPTGKPVPEQRRNWWVPVFVLGMVAGVGLAIAWPKLAPLATCLQDVAQDHAPIRITGTPEEDANWVKIYGEMKPVTNFDKFFGPTYNQLVDFFFKLVRPAAPYPNASQEEEHTYPARLQEWQQRMCKIEGLCPAQTDKSGAGASPYSDIPPGFHVETPATTTR